MPDPYWQTSGGGGLGNSYKPAGTEVLISAVAHNNPTVIPGGTECHHCEHPQLVASCTAQRHTPASHEYHPGVKRIGTSHREFVLKEPVFAKTKGRLYAQVVRIFNLLLLLF